MWLHVPRSETSPSALVGGGLSSDLDEHSAALFARSCTWKGKPMPLPSLRRAWQTAGWLRLLSGLTLSPLTALGGVVSWIASLPVSHARRGVRRGRVEGLKTSGGSGRTSLGSFASFDPASSSWRTSHLSLFEEALPLSSLIWPASGSMRSGACWARTPLEHRTSGTGSSFSRGLYPTPSATPYGSQQNGINGKGGENERPSAGTPSLETWAAKFWPTATAMDSQSSGAAAYSTESGRHAGTTLTDAVGMWPTPTTAHHGGAAHIGGNLTMQGAVTAWATPRATDGTKSAGEGKAIQGTPGLVTQSRAWATPNANDHKGSSKPGQRRRQLSEQTETTLGFSRLAPAIVISGDESSESVPTSRPRLNPAFVEWLMGWPSGWAIPVPMNCGSSETE